MSWVEYEAMRETGRVQESRSTTTHVAHPADPAAYGAQATRGSIYVEFDVPTQSLRPTQAGWATIVGPGSIDGRLAAKRGTPIMAMPEARDIRALFLKREDGAIVPVG